jgi:hypothetical protein
VSQRKRYEINPSLSTQQVRMHNEDMRTHPIGGAVVDVAPLRSIVLSERNASSTLASAL